MHDLPSSNSFREEGTPPPPALQKDTFLMKFVGTFHLLTFIDNYDESQLSCAWRLSFNHDDHGDYEVIQGDHHDYHGAMRSS